METVGDAYVVVSGCPRLNGIKHTSEIASMALELLSHMVVFRVRHLPERQLQLRIGINTGKACDLPGQLFVSAWHSLYRVLEFSANPFYTSLHLAVVKESNAKTLYCLVAFYRSSGSSGCWCDHATLLSLWSRSQHCFENGEHLFA